MTSTTFAKKPSVVRVKPIPRKSAATPAVSNVTGSPIIVPITRTAVRSPAQDALGRRRQPGKTDVSQVERAVHNEELQERVRRLLRQAANMRRSHQSSHPSTSQGDQHFNVTEKTGTPTLRRLLSLLLQESQSETSLSGSLQRILTEVDNVIKEDIEHQLRIQREESDRRLESIVLYLEQTLHQQQSTHLREVSELHGRIEYLQDELSKTRELNEELRQELENINLELLERSENMGNTFAEIEDLRKEVKQLRVYKAKHKKEMQNIEKLREDLENQKLIVKTTLEEFAKVENERDELRSEFDKNLQKLRQSNQRRYETIITELDEALLV